MPQVHWYAIHTRSRFERIVQSELALMGLENFLPAVEEVHRWKDRKKVVERPVFPGYVFARFVDCPEGRLRVLKTHGAVRILGVANAIEAVPDWELDSIRRLVKTQSQFVAHPFLREGAWVRVKRGPLQDVEGRLVRVKSQTRLVLSIDLLSQAVATEVDASDVDVIPGR